MRSKLAAVLLSLSGMLGAVKSADATVYEINFDIQGNPLTGTIVTNDALGTLGVDDFLSWSFQYNGGVPIVGTSASGIIGFLSSDHRWLKHCCLIRPSLVLCFSKIHLL